MRLGDHHAGTSETDPQAWASAIRAVGYSAAVPPWFIQKDEPVANDVLDAFRDATANHDLVTGEIGAWSNPIAPGPEQRQQAHDKCVRMLRRAERLRARCCANITGSRNPDQWDGPHASHFTDETFEMTVASIQHIIDAVDPQHTRYAVETMPWVTPDSPASALQLVDAVDRPCQFAIHLDPANMINCPRRAYGVTGFLHECFDTLGAHIAGVHAKDIRFEPKLTTHLQESRPGIGLMDFDTLLTRTEQTDPELPVFIEHLPDAEQYALARDVLIAAANRNHVELK